MQTMSRDDGFTITELMISMLVTAMVMAGALTMVQNALRLNDSGLQLADSNQNLRAGTNELIRDLLQAGRLIRIGGIPIPSGAGSLGINRPSPPGLAYTFDNVNQTTLSAITTGYQLGPVVNNASTDMITILMIDPILLPVTLPAGAGGIANNGASMTLGAASPWLTGVQAGAEIVSPIKQGDLVWFNFGDGAIQTVTSVDATKAYFAAGATDWFGFNQRAAADGSLMELCTNVGANPCNTGFPSMKVYRLIMLTYYVDTVTTPGTPRLTRMQNHFAPQALAGVVEDLDLTYDLVDGVTNPVNVLGLPFVLNGLTYTSTQIRKVNLHIGVRSDVKSVWQRDYIRLHLNTAVSIRDLASVNRYQ